MSYNLSRKCVERWASTLELLNGDDPVTFRSTDPRKLAYRLREAIAAAKANKIEPFCNLKYEFVIDGIYCIARPKKEESFTLREPTRVTRRFESVTDEFEVVKQASASREHILEFPNFNGDFRSVKLWCSTNGYRVTNDPYLILEKKEEDEDG